MTKSKTPELDMVKDCYSFFRGTVGFKHIATEVPFLSRCIDMVLVNENDVIFTIEFKINNISHAITQAKDHALGADYACICIPENKKVDMELLKNENIGLFLYNPLEHNKARTAYMPNLNKRKVRLFSEMLLKNTVKVLSQTPANA